MAACQTGAGEYGGAQDVGGGVDWSTEATNCGGGVGCLSVAGKREKKGVELGFYRRAGIVWKEGNRG